MGRVKAFECRKDLLDKYGIEYDENKIYTLEDLSEIFATVQAGEGDAFHCIAANGSEDPIYSYFDHTDLCIRRSDGLRSGRGRDRKLF